MAMNSTGRLFDDNDERVIHRIVDVIPHDVYVYQDTPIFTEKPWLRFRTHPTNPRGRK